MLQLARAIVGVASEVLRLVVSFLRSSRAIRAENLVLRKQLAHITSDVFKVDIKENFEHFSERSRQLSDEDETRGEG
jgi:hypothetical protein